MPLPKWWSQKRLTRTRATRGWRPEIRVLANARRRPLDVPCNARCVDGNREHARRRKSEAVEILPVVLRVAEREIDVADERRQLLPAQTGHLVKEVLVPPDTWFVQEVIAQGNRFTIKINDKVVTNFVDEKNTFSKGHFAIQQHSSFKDKASGKEIETIIYVRKAEVKELPPTVK